MGMDETWEQLAPLRELRLAYWVRAVGSRAAMAEARLRLEQQPAFEELARRWDTLEAGERMAAATELEQLLRASAYATRPFCLRCGRCCKNAGPTLYPGDEALLRRGVVSRSQLRTVRAGEEVVSHLEDRRVVLQREQVTIGPARDACRFLDHNMRACTIHDQRPRQCQAQQCWDTVAARQLVGTQGLSRLDLLAEGDAGREAVMEHERRCSPARLRELAEAAREDLAGEAAISLLELVEVDSSLRQRTVDEGLAAVSELPFLFGRNLEEMLRPLGLETLNDEEGNISLRRTR